MPFLFGLLWSVRMFVFEMLFSAFTLILYTSRSLVLSIFFYFFLLLLYSLANQRNHSRKQALNGVGCVIICQTSISHGISWFEFFFRFLFTVPFVIIWFVSMKIAKHWETTIFLQHGPDGPRRQPMFPTIFKSHTMFTSMFALVS